MAEPEARFSRVRWLQNAVCALGMLGALVLVVLGFAGFGDSGSTWMVVAGGFLAFLAVVVMTFVPLLLKVESTINRQLGEIRDLQTAMAAQHKSLESIAQNTRISDAAKSLARRDEEIDALHETIQSNVRGERWDAALNLIDEMERRFGFNEDGARIREEIDEAREERIQAHLTEAIDMIDSHFESHDWTRAQAEIDRLLTALPGDSRVQSLQDRMNGLQEQHKQELKLAWDDAVRRTDTDLAIDVLKELDQYLSPAEAEELQKTARTVFKEKLLQLGIQFRFAVTERRWQDALTVGLEIIRDFPNTRMATEVREALDMLRQRAHQSSDNAPAHASD